MPAREMHFTFDTKTKTNRNTVAQFIEDFSVTVDDFQNIKKAFGVADIDQGFLKMFINELKAFDNVSWDDRMGVSDRQKIVVDFIKDIIGDEPKEPQTVLGIRYLYDEWDYEGCGHDDHYYLTFTDDVKMAKKTIKQTEKLVTKLNNLGVKAKLIIEEA